MQGHRILGVGGPADLDWMDLLPAMAAAAQVEGQELEATDDPAVVEGRLEEGAVDVVAVCSEALIASPRLDCFLELAAIRPGYKRILVEEATGHLPMIEALSHRLGYVELGLGFPVSWLVRTAEVPPGEAEAQLWLRTIYEPSVLHPFELPPHPAHDLYWEEVRRVRAARPPR